MKREFSHVLAALAVIGVSQLGAPDGRAAWVDNVPGHHRVWLKQVDPSFDAWRSDAERPWIAAVVRQVDASGQALVIQHGPSRKPRMKAMTMRLPVRGTVHLPMLKPGDRVQIRAAENAGRVEIVDLQMAH